MRVESFDDIILPHLLQLRFAGADKVNTIQGRSNKVVNPPIGQYKILPAENEHAFRLFRIIP